MTQFKVEKAFKIDEVEQEIGAVLELSDELAAPLIAEGSLVAVEAVPEAPASSSPEDEDAPKEEVQG